MSCPDNKKIPFSRREGYIEIKLFDEGFNKIFESKAGLKDEKNIIKLGNDLKDKGVKLI